jgi:hypothetical protein
LKDGAFAFYGIGFRISTKINRRPGGRQTVNRKVFSTKSQSITIFSFTQSVNLSVLEPLRQWFDEKLTNRLSASLSGNQNRPETGILCPYGKRLLYNGTVPAMRGKNKLKNIFIFKDQ